MEGVLARPTRRAVLKYGVGGLATVVAGSSVVLSARRASADTVNARLYIGVGQRTMIDGLVVPVVGFGGTPDRVELPSGQLEVQPGDTVNLTLKNNASMQVGFAVPATGFTAPPLEPGATRVVTFTAPAKPGTYYYVGTVSGSADTGRALGATGALVVLPRGQDRRSVEASFPGVLAKARRQPMFGTTTATTMPVAVAQERTWVFAELNPDNARDLAGGRVALPSDPEPEYFLINGLSGMLAVEDHETNLTGEAGALGTPGEAFLLRMINTGRAPRSVHMHGNHFWILSHPDTPWIVGASKDTVRVPSGTAVDVLVPFEAPPDSFPVTREAQKYVVHDHIEMAETASGGHYPAGMVSELIFE